MERSEVKVKVSTTEVAEKVERGEDISKGEGSVRALEQLGTLRSLGSPCLRGHRAYLPSPGHNPSLYRLTLPSGKRALRGVRSIQPATTVRLVDLVHLQRWATNRLSFTN